MLANVTVPILGVVDTGVVGQIPQAAPIAAVGVGAIILGAIYWIFGFLRMGTAGLTAQATGQGNRAEVAALLTRSLMIGLAGGAAIIALQQLVYAGAFAISPAGPEVESLARDYMQIRIWSAPAAIAIYGINGWLIAQERTRDVLILQVWMNGANILLDLLFVLQLGWGVSGVAFATFLAEWSGLAMGLYLCRAAFRVPDWRDWPRVFDREKLKNMAVVNTDIMLRSLMLQAIFVSFLLLGGKFDAVTLAANQVLLQFLHVMSFALDGFAFAAEALVGQAMGAKAVQQLRRSAVLTSLWGLGCNVLFALAFALLGGIVINTMAKDPEVQQAARAYLPWMVAAPLVGLASWMLDGIFIGATRTGDMRNMMAISAVIYAASVALLIGPLGNHGLWLALLISFVARAITLGLRYPALERAAQNG
ncbi:multidrug resistance protein, MATE family [Tropicibacter naphthalenivorans]|uniref:DNA-damage-inducible protein F n=2 Tax=Tropicibacter naphthalenivorans TaxID=441103 RepID=A0A0P1GGV3_9RHOB|nr:DNA-damage-inducible protein F [Tropicibacter naphthalenivorans]SMC90771.1 multidrug resistance protein, MATE family [Tropicibacter naphthalenivorans]